MKWWCFIGLLFVAPLVVAQCEISGHITSSEDGGPAPFVHAVLYQDTMKVVGVMSDLEGNFRMENLKEGTYTLVLKYVGYADLRMEHVQAQCTPSTFTTLQLTFPPPCPYSDKRPSKCPNDHRKSIIPIVYGLPSSGLMKEEKQGKV